MIKWEKKHTKDEPSIKVFARYNELETAKEYGMTPSQWDRHSRSDKEEMMAFIYAGHKVQQYQDWWLAEKSKSKNVK